MTEDQTTESGTNAGRDAGGGSTGGQSPGHPRNRRRWGRLAALLLFLALPIAAGAYWVMSQPPGTGVMSSLRTAGVPVPDAVLTLLDPGSVELAQPAPEPLAELPAAPAAQSPPPSVPAGRDPVEERLAALEGLLTAHDAVQKDQAGEVERLASAIERFQAGLEKLAGQQQANADLAAKALDTAELALREARHGRSLVEAATGDRDARLELLEADVLALATALRTARAINASLSDRIDSVAADLHLAARFSQGRTGPATGFGAVSSTEQAPFQSNYHSTADAAAAASPPPESVIQGQYRVGDWVAGWGVVSAIRRTPDGDHITTPRGVLFAPAAAADQ